MGVVLETFLDTPRQGSSLDKLGTHEVVFTNHQEVSLRRANIIKYEGEP